MKILRQGNLQLYLVEVGLLLSIILI